MSGCEHHEHHHGHHQERHECRCGGHHGECGCQQRHECRCGYGHRGDHCGCHSRCGCQGRCGDHGGTGHQGCDCQQRGFKRRFRGKGEQIAELEGYLADLKAEVQAVEERLAGLRR